MSRIGLAFFMKTLRQGFWRSPSLSHLSGPQSFTLAMASVLSLAAS